MLDMLAQPAHSWTGYRVALRLFSPVHIGWRSIGNLKQTRPYVPGSALWGALAVRLAEDFRPDNNRRAEPSDYRKAEQDVDQHMRFTYFYPSRQPDRVTLFPWEKGRAEFEWLFLSSYMSTSLRQGRMAESGFLHEIEYISSRARDGSDVWLVGYCWTDNSWPVTDLNKLWASVHIGGERTYGFGRIADAQVDHVDGCVFDEFEPELTDGVVLRAQGAHRVCAHVVDEIQNAHAIEVEPLIGRNIDPAGRYRLTKGVAAYSPGTVCEHSQTWKITERGLWKSAVGTADLSESAANPVRATRNE